MTVQPDGSRYDVAIVGGGPAGLSAALVLGRARRSVIVFDDGRPRNARSHRLGGLLSRDGIAPLEFLRLGREELGRYSSIHMRSARVVDARRTKVGFELTTADGQSHVSRRLVLATGVADELPSVEGLEALYGKSVFHCPYCDGWEVRDQPLAVIGWDDEHGGGLALELFQWSRDVVLCLDGSDGLSSAFRERLARHGVAVRGERIAHVDGSDGIVEQITFASGPPLPRRAIFFFTRRRQASDLAARLGCEGYAPDGCCVDERGRCNVPGLFIIGDASRDVLQVSVAVAEGAKAAVTVNADLTAEDLP